MMELACLPKREEPKCEEPKCEEPKCEEPRKVVIAYFSAPIMTYIIPKGFDLDDKEQVKDHWVKHGTLYISLTNGKVLKVDSRLGIEDPDYKYPEETEIVDADGSECDFEDEEEPPLQYVSDSD